MPGSMAGFLRAAGGEWSSRLGLARRHFQSSHRQGRISPEEGQVLPHPVDQWEWHESEHRIELTEAQRACGRHCLYVWLRLMGNGVDYSAVEDQLKVSKEGSSLADISRASRHWQPPLEIIRANPELLAGVSLPAIAHIWRNDQGERVGHYVVLVNVDADSVYVADGTAQLAGRIPLPSFLESWSGYLLVRADAPRRATSIGPWVERSLLMLNVLLLVVGLVLTPRRDRRRVRIGCAGIACLALLPLSGCGKSPSPLSAAPAAQSEVAASEGTEDLLSVPITKKEIGLVELGKPAKATFTVTNVSKRTLKLKLGYPSCSCTSATLSKEEVAPGESADLTMVISSSRESGPQQASISLGTVQPARVWRFLIQAVIEGLEFDEYTLRVPDPKTTKLHPQPITGRLVIGKHKKQAEVVRVVQQPAPGKGPAGIDFGEPQLSEREEFETFCRYWVKIPIRTGADSPPQSGKFGYRVTFRVDDKLGETGGNIIIVPLQSLPTARK
jgi:hypothetical protein